MREKIQARAGRCGSVFSARRLRVIFVGGLHRSIQASTMNHLSMSKRLTFSDIKTYVMSEGNDERIEYKPTREMEYQIGKKAKPFAKVHIFKEENINSSDTTSSNQGDGGSERIFYVHTAAANALLASPPSSSASSAVFPRKTPLLDVHKPR